MGDLEIVEAIVESWILEATKDPNNDIAIENKVKITATNSDPITKGSIMFSGHTLNVTFPGVRDAVLYQLKSIVGLKFEKVSNDAANLYYCTVTYEYRNGLVTKEQTYTFCVYPRVGEIVSVPSEPVNPAE
jgi:hypothetical protein